MKKIPVYYASEEEGYEKFLMGEFNTTEQAMEFVNKVLKGDDIDETCDSRGWDGEDEEGYRVVYGIGEHGVAHIDYLREKMEHELE